MSFVRRLTLSLAVVAAVSSAACGDPPEKEMQQAQGAIDAARAAGAAKGPPAATAALNAAPAKMRAENGRGNTRALAAARRTIASDETAVQEARTAFEAGDYPASIDKSKGATARLRAAIHDLDAT